MLRPYSKLPLFLLAATCSTLASAQSGTTSGGDDIYELSPFEVTTDKDKGYYAANAVTGSRVDVRIQDLPLTIEVVTAEFIEDTGSTDLRESLRYSAGILLQSQNDAYGGIDNIGGVNNPEGATANKSNTGFKIRGFVTNNTLRNGFRRQHATDTVNIERVEVVRGPSALLYGVGNFGGVVNYLSKTPLPYFATSISLGVGSEGWKRASLDVTGPISEDFFGGSLGYRVTGAVESADHWTESQSSKSSFFSPVIEWSNQKTKVTLDIEVGTAEDRGIDFKSVRAPSTAISPDQGDRLQTFGFLEFPGKDPRTFRWSGPDTYYLTDSWNVNAQLQHEIIDNLYLLAGVNKSKVAFDTRSVGASLFFNLTNPRAVPLQDTIEAIQIIDGQNSDVRKQVDNAVLGYAWGSNQEVIDWIQVRTELNYTFNTLADSRWLSAKHSVLLGYSWEEQENAGQSQDMEKPASDDSLFVYKNPTDASVIRFGPGPDGTGIPSLRDRQQSGSVGANTGLYAVYSLKLLEDKLFIIGGMRRDTSTSEDGFTLRDPWALRPGPLELTEFDDSKVAKTTGQWGISYEFLDGFTVYALQSEGIEPNFNGARDGLGVALDSSSATANEFGFKVNLMEGKIAASVSFFEIEREGVPFTYWWAPAPATERFQRDADIVYALSGNALAPHFENIEAAYNNRVQNGDELGEVGRIFDNVSLARSEWEAGRASGAIYDLTDDNGNTTGTYVNASKPEGAAYLDALSNVLNAEFDKPASERRDPDPWVGWLYNGTGFADSDPEVNNAAMDISSLNNFSQSISDKSEGWEAQVILSPIDEFQIILNYSNVKREVTNPGAFVSYPYEPGNWDRWAPWYWPNNQWGLGGQQPEIAYPGGQNGLPSENTADWSGVGWGKGQSLDDTPEHAFSFWSSWTFSSNSPLDGLQFGLGGSWESSREYASEFTSAGQKKENTTDTSINAKTDSRLTMNGMVKYSWETGENDTEWYVQLNVDNFLDDTDQYGFIYAPGISWRFQSGISF